MQRKNTKGCPWRQGELERTDDTCMEQGPVKTAWGAWKFPVWERKGTSGALARILLAIDLLSDLGCVFPSQAKSLAMSGVRKN